MSNKGSLCGILFLVALGISPFPIHAIQNLTIDTNVVTISTPTVSDFDTGYVEQLAANTLTVESDINWKLTLKGTTASWSCTGAGCWGVKPRADVLWRPSGGGAYTSLSATEATLATGGTTSPPGTVDVVVDYRIKVAWESDAEGTYDYDFITYLLSPL
ncbi:hypothetical protein H8D30_01250 [bacterium]|nr:hypothetical protein [bacterium]